MVNTEELQAAILGNLVDQHPELAPDIDEMTKALLPFEREAIIKGMLKHPAGINLETIGHLPEDKQCINSMSADHILKTSWPTTIWAVPTFLPVGLTILAGAPKIGKSWLSLQLAMAISSGEFFFGKAVEKGPVLVCALEDPPRRLKSRMEAMGWPEGLEVDFITIQPIGQQGWSIANGGSEKLARQIFDKRYRLVVIDTLSRAIPGDQADVQSMTKELAPLQEMAHQVGCVIMLKDHHRKSGLSAPDAIADILGSTAKGAMADTVWSLYRERGKNGANLAITGRDVEEQELALEFDIGCCSWLCKGRADEIELTNRRKDILGALETLGKVQLNEIMKAVGQPKSHTHTHVYRIS